MKHPFSNVTGISLNWLSPEVYLHEDKLYNMVTVLGTLARFNIILTCECNNFFREVKDVEKILKKF